MTRPGQENEQDAAIEKLLRQREGQAQPAGGPACGDAELLAAYAEGSLPERQGAGFEQHLAACGACREAVAGLVRLAPRTAAAVPSPPEPAWWTRWAWVAPALAGMVLVGSFAWYERERILEPLQKQVPAMGRVQQPPAAPAEPSAPPASAAEAPVPKPSEKDQLAGLRARAGAPGPSGGAETSAKRPDAPGRSSAGLAKTIPPGGVAGRVGGVVPSQEAYAPAPPAAPEQAPKKIESKEEEKAALDRRLADREKAVVRDEAAPAAPEVHRALDDAAGAKAKKQNREMLSMSRPTSGQEGRRESLPLNSAVPLTAKTGAVTAGAPAKLPAEGVVIQRQRLVEQHVWALFEDGRLFHSSDAGQSWQAVIVPEPARSFSFEDEKSGQIVARSGGRYTTADGGKTWRKSKNE